MNQCSPPAVLLLLAALFAACGSSTETQERPPLPPPRDFQPPPPKIEFQTKTDTVAMERSHIDSLSARQHRDVQVKYMVQIGAFKDPKCASGVQVTARERYHMPALNDYNTALALYQIRIGFFETREDAYAFRQRMQKDYPLDYKDAWVVQLKR